MNFVLRVHCCRSDAARVIRLSDLYAAWLLHTSYFGFILSSDLQICIYYLPVIDIPVILLE